MKKNHTKMDNNGSTLVLVIVIVTFMMILGSLIMSMTATNLRLKVYDKKSKVNQYETESGMTEVKTGLNEISTIAMKDSYQQVFDHYVTVNATDEGLTSTFDRIYLMQLVSFLADQNCNPYDASGYEYKPEVLQNYITDGSENARATFLTLNPAGDNRIDFPWAESGFKSDCEHYIMLRNVNIQCTDAEGYQTTVTTDIRMDCPPVFFASSGIYPEYTQYSLIADDTLNFRGASLTVRGNVYAGAGETYSRLSQSTFAYPYKDVGGIQFINGTSVDISANTIITRGNMAIQNNARAYIEGDSAHYTSVWAENIETVFQSVSVNRTPTAARLDLVANCNVSDDLQLNAHNSRVTINGNYNGFSYNRNQTLSDPYTDARYSSAIMVNGQKSTLNLNNVTNMSLSGTSFISRMLSDGTSVMADINATTGGDDILTGETVTIKSNQAAYMVADDYIMFDHNPVLKSEVESVASAATDSSVAIVNTELIKREEPDLYKLLTCYDDPSTPEDDSTGDGYAAFYYNSGQDGMVPVVYFYYEFKDQESANKYLQNYLQQTTRNGVGQNKRLGNLAEQFFSQSNVGSVLKLNSILGSPHTRGNISYYDDGKMKISTTSSSIPSSTEMSTIKSVAQEYYSRQRALIDKYADAGSDYRFEDTASDQTEDKGILRLYDVLIQRDNIVNDDAEDESVWGFNNQHIKVVDIPERSASVYIINNYGGSTVQVSSLCSGHYRNGIIVTTGDLDLNTDFTGLIITGGVLNMTGGSATADKRLVQYILKYIVAQEKAAPDGSEWKSVKCLSRYFNEFEAKDNLSAVDAIDISDFTYFENWQRNKDE